MSYPAKPDPFQGEQNTSKAAIEKNAGIYQGKQKKGGSRAGRQYKRKAKGQHGGGQFAAGGGGGSTTSQSRVTAAQRRVAAAQRQRQQTINLQTQLNSMGAHLKVDGIYGPKTAAAVAALQKKYGIQGYTTARTQSYLKAFAKKQAAAKQKAAQAATARGAAIRQRGQAAASQRGATAGKPAAASSSSAGGKSAAAVQARLAQQLKRR